jgi:hypothetical protein
MHGIEARGRGKQYGYGAAQAVGQDGAARGKQDGDGAAQAAGQEGAALGGGARVEGEKGATVAVALGAWKIGGTCAGARTPVGEGWEGAWVLGEKDAVLVQAETAAPMVAHGCCSFGGAQVWATPGRRIGPGHVAWGG